MTPAGATARAVDTTAEAEAPAEQAAPAVAKAAFPFRDVRQKLDRKVGLTFLSLWEMPHSEAPSQEGFENFLKLVKQDADYGGSVEELEKVDEELHNLLVIRLMAIMRHGSPLIPNPMWHFFAPLGRIVSIVQQHKDFKGSTTCAAINDETVLCAPMTADCHSSAP